MKENYDNKRIDQCGKNKILNSKNSLLSEDAWEDYFSASLFSKLSNDDNGISKESYHSSFSNYYKSDLLCKKYPNFFDEFLQDSSSFSLLTNQSKMFNTYVNEPGRQLRLIRRNILDPLWKQIQLEAQHFLSDEPGAGPQLYQFILSQPSLIDALATIVSHEIETELIPAPALRSLILDMLTAEDDRNVHLDVIASVNRNPSNSATALTVVLFHQGLHALLCYRVGHRLWSAQRTGMAYYMQSTVSARYSADIHPSCQIGGGTYLNVGGGVVIGETARVGNDVTILQGVTLGGTGKEGGDRHPKVGDGVILHCGATVLGNIPVGDGAVVTSMSIVTKPVPTLARVSGVPATVKSYRELREEDVSSDDVDDEFDLERRLKQLYADHSAALEAMVEMELCMDSGGSECWDMFEQRLHSSN